MSDSSDSHDDGAGRGVISGARVRHIPEPVQIAAGAAEPGEAGKGAIAVIPVIEGQRVAGFEIRCRCGACVVVECVYDQEGET